jgi:N-acetylneuraminic acid mutarotase
MVFVTFLTACGGGGGGGGDSTNGDITGEDDSSTGGDTASTGIDLKLNLAKDDFWEFYWFNDTTTFAQGSGGATSTTDFGIFRVTLGPSINASGLVAYPLNVTGEAGTYLPRWTHVALNNDGSLMGSTDGSNFEVIFDITSAEWSGGGFFHDFEDNLVSISEAVLEGEYNTVNALKLGYSDREGGCETILGFTLCEDTSTTFSFNEYHKEGIGPVGFRQDSTYTSDGGGFFTSSTIKKTVELIETSETATDSTAFNRPDWEPMAPLATARSQPSAVALNGKIYVLGGFDNNSNFLDSMEIYDPTTNTWSAGPTIPSSVNSEAHVVGGKIYVESSSAVDDIHIFDGNSWSTVTTTNAGGVFGASDAYTDATWGPLIIGVEGVNSAIDPLKVWAYQPSKNEWLVGADLQIRVLLRPSVTILDDTTMYVIGGFGSLTSCGFFSCDWGSLDWVYKYDLASDTWDTSSATDMNTERDNLETVNLNGKIIAIGGNPVSCSSASSCNIGAPLRSAESYDPATNTWTDISSMLTPRKDFAAVVLNGDLYVIGGNDGSQKTANVERYRP